MNECNTAFAPAERASAAELSRDAGRLAEAGICDHVGHVAPIVLTILNPQRQVIYCNRRMLEWLGLDSDRTLIGRRPGEILDCVHASESPGGCGTTEFCRECGAVRAILRSQSEQIGVETECRITTRAGQAYEFRVWASPYHFSGELYTVFSLIDISDEKRRQALERSLFHDMNNLLAAINANAELGTRSKNSDNIARYLNTILLAGHELTEEIAAHRRMLQAEAGELELRIEPVGSRSVINDLVRIALMHWPERLVVISGAAEDFELETDRSLLFRILYNMLKNALEASTPEKTVLIGCSRDAESALFSVFNPDYMDRSTQLQIFQRSFSTKGRGRGIGTYSMKLFGEHYLKGRVWFSTSEDSGTTFHLAVPLLYGPA